MANGLNIYDLKKKSRCCSDPVLGLYRLQLNNFIGIYLRYEHFNRIVDTKTIIIQTEPNV